MEGDNTAVKKKKVNAGNWIKQYLLLSEHQE